MMLILILLVSMLPSYNINPVQAAASELLSLNKPVLASSVQGEHTKDRAVDGNSSTRWASQGQMDPQWIYVDLGAEATVDRVRLNWETAYAKSYKVEVSEDGMTWFSIYSTTSGDGSIDDLTNLSGTGRYVRIYGTERGTPYGYSLYEFEVYGHYTTPQPPAPVNLAENKSASASSYEVPDWSSDPNIVSPQKAFDGDTTTRWSSRSGDSEWISVDLGSVYTMGTVVLNWEDAFAKGYDIQVSMDGQNWTTVYRQLYGQGGIETLKIKADARYVRMYGFAKGTEFGYSLYEFKVYAFVEGDPIPEIHIPEKPSPEVVSVGAGSYLKNDISKVYPTYPKYKTSNVTGPIPSGGWWQSTLIKRLSDGIVGLPFRVQYTDQGLSIMNPGSGFVTADGNTVSTTGAPDFYLMAKNINPIHMSAKVDGYGDYSVRNVLSDDDSAKMVTTVVKGSPYLYNEFSDSSSPYIVMNESITRFFDDSNQTILATDGSTLITDHIGIEVTNVDSGNNQRIRSYGLFAPEGTVFTRVGDKLTLQLGQGQNYLSIGTLPSNRDLNYYYQHAYAFVTDTKASYSIDDAEGLVTTTYTSTTQLKRSGFTNTALMALFPNQWKSLTDAATLTHLTYPSIRGTMKVLEGNSFFIEDRFTGIIPQFGEPNGSSSYNRAEVVGYLQSLNDMLRNNYMWNDPYWQGKNLHPLAQSVLIADQIGETTIRDESLDILKNILTNWYTYSGDSEYPYYLYYTPEWGALHGDGGNHGMAKWLSDHHYLWGYYIYASAILASYDKEFLNDYGGMVEHMIRDMGSPSRNDSMYPYMRAFDPYEGVSWAGGYGDNYNGNNQEATAEALFAYAGEYLWGVVTNNKAYRDAGIWVYTLESNSTLQYWFDYDQDNWHPDYNRGVVGQLYGSSQHYGTYFSSDANNIYGIQWLPTAPYMTYLGLNPDAAARTYSKFIHDKGGLETGWYHIIWPFQSMSDPQGAIAKWDANLVANDSNDGKKEWANTYWFLHAMEAFGTRTTDIWSSNWTTYQIFEKNGVYTANIWNPTNTMKDVIFRDDNGTIVGMVTVPSMETVVANPINGNRPPEETEQVAMPTISVNSGTYDSPQTVEISSSTSGATIRYTIDGSTPTAAHGIIYSGAFDVSETMTIKAVAFKNGMADSDVATSVITIHTSDSSNLALNKEASASSYQGGNVASAAFDGDNNTRWESSFSDPQWVTVDLGSIYSITGVKLDWETAAGKDYAIQVSDDRQAWQDVLIQNDGTGGVEVHTFNAPITGRYVRMYGTERTTGYGYSLWEFEVFGTSSSQQQAAAPDITPVTGTYTGVQHVSITSTTEDATIKYTTDGSTPTPAHGTVYTGAFDVSETTTVKAIAYKSGLLASNVATSVITINSSDSSNLALNKTATASSQLGGNTAEAAFDGDANTRWESSHSDPQWIMVDLGSIYNITGVKLNWETAAGKDYTIQISDDQQQWEEAFTMTGGTGGVEVHTFNMPVTGRYVRLYGTVRTTGYGYSLWEFEVYGSEVTLNENKALNKTAAASSYLGGNTAEAAFDGDANTRWESSYSDPQWITVDLGSTYNIAGVKLDWEAAAGKDYKIQVSDDQQYWEDAFTMTGGTGGIEVHTFNTPVTGRYVRLYGTARTTGYGYSLWEFEVYGSK
jgi:endo-1,3(4)-beta-glucanase